MSAIDKLASALGRRDEVPNQELAAQVAARNDKNAVKELVEGLAGKQKDIQSDCIKVLYEIGALKPALIAPYANVFVGLLGSKNNRLQWGAMTALAAIAGEVPGIIYSAIATIAGAAGKGSVITRDNYVKILVALCGVTEYADSAFTLLNEQLLAAPTNQLPMYAELALPVVNQENSTQFVKSLKARLDDMDKESKRKRVEKVIAKAQKAKEGAKGRRK